MVSLWSADCGAETLGAWEAFGLSWLQESERRRYRHFLRAERRRQFLVGRVLLRHALSLACEGAPAAWRIADRPGAGPVLGSPGPRGVRFSIAHSRDRVVCLLAERLRPGVDLEYGRPQRDWVGIAAASFHPANAAELEGRPEDERADYFYEIWTLREATFKARADRISGGVPRSRPSARTRLPVLATSRLGDYSLAIALCGFPSPPHQVHHLSPDGRASAADIRWTRHAMRRTCASASPPRFVPLDPPADRNAYGPTPR